MIKTKLLKLKPEQRGSLLAGILIVAVVFTTIALSLMTFTTSQYTRTTRNTFAANAALVAEAGIEEALIQLNQDGDFNGYANEQIFFDEAGQGRGTYTVSVEDSPSTNAKIITATGRVYRHGDSGEEVSSRSVKVTVVGTTSEGYSVHSGPGGLILGGSANITNSNVYVNGTITMSGAARIGTQNQPLNVNVAHMACPTGSNPGPTYPVVCGSGNPISMAWSTYIYGTVCATNQTNLGPNPSGNIRPGNGGEGLKLGCVAPPASTPTYDRTAHIAAMTTTAQANNIDYNCSQWKNPVGFVRTWPARLRLNGNVNIASSCELTITGDVYITGNLDIGGAARIRIADSVGTDRPVIVVDGNITAGGSAVMITNSSGTGAHFISFRTNAPCNPNCTSLTGTQLKNSQNYTTVNVAGAGNFPGTIFHSYWGKIILGGSGNMGSAVGQTIDLSGAGTVTFGTALSSGDTTWTVTSYQQVFD